MDDARLGVSARVVRDARFDLEGRPIRPARMIDPTA
jgi:hypothetical protein